MTTFSDAPTPVYRDDQGDLAARLDGLVAASDAARGRLPDSLLTGADMLSGRAVERLRLSGEHTIVALAGATGSGKSSLFNALTDLELAGVGLRRPTTSWALACAWGPDGAEGLLQWMGIPPRHQVSRMSMLDRSSDDTKLDGLVLLDLPDHDSTEVSHHVEMDRLVQYADLVVWVLDPQKYADAAIHDRYIRPMASYSDVTIVVLNQLDRIPYGQRERALDDVKRIIAEGGLGDVPVIGVSATRGDGIDDLKRELAARIRAKASAKDRLSSDILAAAETIASVGGRSDVPGVTDADRAELDRALIDAAGVPEIVEATVSATRRRAVRQTGWPLTRWIARLRKDPLAELDLGRGLSPRALERASTGQPVQAQRSEADTAVRVFAEKASVGLERPWRDAVRVAAASQTTQIGADVDRAVADVATSGPAAAWWWPVVNVLQWLLFLGAVGSALWWIAAAIGTGSSALFDPPSVDGYGPADGRMLPAVLTIVCVVAGIVLAGLSRLLARATARARARKADTELRAAIAAVAHEQVVEPVRAELDAYQRYRTGILTALG